MLHMQGDQWLKTLPCGLVRSMLPLDHLHPVPARPEHHRNHRRSHHGLGCASVPAMPHHRGNADCRTWPMNTTNASLHLHCIINPKFWMLFRFVMLFFFFFRNKFIWCAFVPSYKISEDTGWDGFILPVPEYSFEGLFRTVSCHLQTQCMSPGEELQRS